MIPVNQQDEEKSSSPGKQRVSFQLPTELIERARNAVYWTPGLTLNELAEVAFSHTLNCMEVLRAEAFPPRTGRLKAGRQVR